MANPVRMSAKEERGTYIVFNSNQWRKERVSLLHLQNEANNFQREMHLNYDDLEQRHASIAANQPEFQ
jgi:hypothetical protein